MKIMKVMLLIHGKGNTEAFERKDSNLKLLRNGGSKIFLTVFKYQKIAYLFGYS